MSKAIGYKSKSRAGIPGKMQRP